METWRLPAGPASISRIPSAVAVDSGNVAWLQSWTGMAPCPSAANAGADDGVYGM
jgi:hypothetical protein